MGKQAVGSKSGAADAAKYVPTPPERAAIEEYLTKHREQGQVPHVLVRDGDDGVRQLVPDHQDAAVGQAMLMRALGTTDIDFLNGILGQLANAGSTGPELKERGLNFMLSMVGGIGPNDQVETMLAAQMAAVHMATMTFARRLAHVDNIPQQDSAERAFNKLARTFTAQVETLKRYRSKGVQKMTVEHVTVNDGGQAIVGNVSRGGRGRAKAGETTP